VSREWAARRVAPQCAAGRAGPREIASCEAEGSKRQVEAEPAAVDTHRARREWRAVPRSDGAADWRAHAGAAVDCRTTSVFTSIRPPFVAHGRLPASRAPTGRTRSLRVSRPFRRVVGLAAALAAVYLSGCGSAHTQQPVQLYASTQPVSHQFDCIASQVPKEAHVRSSAGIKGHGFHPAPTLVVEWPEQVLLVKEASSANEATQWASEFKTHVDSTTTHAAYSAAFGRFVVQWGPNSPSKSQGAVLEGCL
jgi:hypothetical protein